MNEKYNKLDVPIPALLFANDECYPVSIMRKRRGRYEVRLEGEDAVKIKSARLTRTLYPGKVMSVPMAMVEIQHGR